MGVNPNMPLRLLLYIARIYEYLIEQWKQGSLYRERLIKLPFPQFIGRVRENRKLMGLEGAMKEAVEYCIAHNILSAFLIKHRTEVKHMLLTEWNIDDAKEVWQEEAREEGWEKGKEAGRAETVKEVMELIRQGYISEEELRKHLK
jgi:hypothetical protein